MLEPDIAAMPYGCTIGSFAAVMCVRLVFTGSRWWSGLFVVQLFWSTAECWMAGIRHPVAATIVLTDIRPYNY